MLINLVQFYFYIYLFQLRHLLIIFDLLNILELNQYVKLYF